MVRLRVMLIPGLAALSVTAGAEVFVGAGQPLRSLGLVTNPCFESGGYTYADHWRPLPGSFRMLRRATEGGGHSLYLQLREDGDGGVLQTVDLPPGRSLSLRILATSWSDEGSAVVASLVRRTDGLLLCEVVVDGIERGEMAQSFDTGPGGPAELMVRLVGRRGARASIDRVSIGPPVETRQAAVEADFSAHDLVLEVGDGLRVNADFEPSVLPQAAEMLQEAIEDLTGGPAERVAAAVSVSVPQPETTQWPARESYHLRVSEEGVRIDAPAERGAFWGMMTLIDLLRPQPDGGARILAVDVRDQPALPWRIGIDGDLLGGGRAGNAARRLARLKLNMALVAYSAGEQPSGDAAVVAALRDVGIEPIIGIPATCPVRPTAVMADIQTRLHANLVGIDPWRDREPLSGSLDWTDPVLAAGREAAEEMTVLVPAYTCSDFLSDGGGECKPLPSGEMERWPREIVACLLPDTHSEAAARQMAAAEASGIRYVVRDDTSGDGADAALRARNRIGDCLGVAIGGRDEPQQEAADLAWGGVSPEG
ncbi:MAG: glycoside hydrolase family 20 zincin-like fold domain-containing protein [Armatimonadota bacterium]|nr:glycoside hydrolase family 20 zincin-like fold domain-containing protein [Armatimonadota bacterium]